MWWLCGVDTALPIGDIVYIVGIVVINIYNLTEVDETTFNLPAESKGKSKSEVDPYARPGQKKQGRENKNKSRQRDNFKPRNNRRDGKPAPPKHHTPGRDHQRFSQSGKAKLNMMYKKIG